MHISLLILDYEKVAIIMWEIKQKTEKYFLFVIKSRGVEEEYKITKSILDSPEAVELGEKKIKDFLEEVYFSGKSELINGENKFIINSTFRFLEKVKEAGKITGAMTRTAKMPGLSYSLPAWACQTGSKLRKGKTSPCYGCYALKGNYTRYPAIKAAQYYRLASLMEPDWIPAMVAQIKRQKWFRWHDAGDVQILEHLNNIYKICEATPETRHWLPTREAWIKNELDRTPDNLVIRFSPPMMGQRVDTWPNSSMVVDSGASCPAPKQGGKCGSCRQSWDPAVKVVSYGKH